MKDLFKRKENITSQINVSDGVFNSDLIIKRSVTNQFHNTSKLISYYFQIFLNETIEKRSVFLSSIKVIKLIYVGS